MMPLLFKFLILKQKNPFYTKQNGSLTYKAGKCGAALTEAGRETLGSPGCFHPATPKRPSLENECWR